MRNVIGDYEGFVSTINRRFSQIGIDAGRELVMCDHLCYRVENLDRYQALSEGLGRFATLIGEAEVSGRPISTFELFEPIAAGGWIIPFIELPAPKEGSPYPEGLEHAEFVVPSLTRFRSRHHELPFSNKGMNKVINPELGLKMDDLSVKFHEIPLGAVVRLEQRLDLG